MKTTEDAVGNFLKRVRVAMHRHRMARPGDRILVAVSGGADSVAMLDALVRLAPEEGFSAAVAHFNHGLRGGEADADEAFVASLAHSYGLEFYAGRGDVAAVARAEGRGLEAAARRLRHGFLRATAAEHGCAAIALGHTASDRVETVLLHLLRGTGLAGLQGMRPVRRPFIRPLITIWRPQVEEYCRTAGLRWRTDDTNRDTRRFLRNRIRHELLPMLEREYGPGVCRAILRCAEAVEMELSWTEPLVREALAEAAERYDRGIRLSLERLKGLPEGLLMRILRAAALAAFGGACDWRWEHFAALASAIRVGLTGHRVMLPGGLEARVAYEWLDLTTAQPEPSALPERPLLVPGEVEIPEAGVRLSGRLCSRHEAPVPGPQVAVLDAALAEGLVVRGWRPGDAFVPLGMTGRKKLQDFFVDAKVPRAVRKLTPLVVHPQAGVIWVAGMRIAQGARAPAGAGVVLVLEMRPTSDVSGAEGLS
ncbi:MAG: tRNA lysidine(34) synthetase TilS [Armatimonadetes bacterium]|nr:tRNA lysidine(34) synthetase TilS [Armatimonadota bacterium]